MYKPENLTRWEKPDHFAQWHHGAPYNSEWFVFMSRHRDSDILTESNWNVALRELGGESDTVKITRESHWAVGWVEWIGIHESDEASLETADEIVGALSDYPVLCDEDFSEREYDTAKSVWRDCFSIRDRVELCRDAGISIFAARREYPPSDDSGYLQDRLLGY